MKKLRDLAFLREPMTAEAKGLDSVDPALAELSTMADKEQFDDLATRVESLFDAGVNDVRAITYYLWLEWRRSGVSALTEIFTTLTALVSVNLESLGPVEKRDTHFAKRLAWLSLKIGDGIQYHESKRTADWRAWASGVSPEQIDAAIKALGGLDAALPPTFLPARQALTALAPRLHGLAEAFARPVDDPPVSEPGDGHASGEGAAPAVAAATEGGRMVVRSGRAEVGVSPAYFELVQKLAAFQKLVDKKEMVKAAVVADDIMRSVDNFDPRTYFPDMFADFSEKFSDNIEALSSFWGQRDSTAWKAMVQFYRVDLRRFVGG